LGAIWSRQNKDSLEQFLSLPAPVAPLPREVPPQERTAGDIFGAGQHLPGRSDDVCLLQLLKDPLPDSGR
jgi:hypothetical protein